MTEQISGYVLAGGRSSRMGEDKAFLDLNGEPLVDRAVRLVASVCGDVYILSGSREDPDREADLSRLAPLIPDRTPLAGPLGGLDAALHHARREWLLVVPVDLPLLPPMLLAAFVRSVKGTKSKIACLSTGDGDQTLPVLIHRSACTHIEDSLRRGKLSLLLAFESAATALGTKLTVLPAGSLLRGDPAAWFLNCNTPADLARIREIASNRSASAASE